MKKFYGIGLFAIVLLFLLCLSMGYQFTYHAMMDRQEVRLEEEKKNAVTTKGVAEKNNGYYVRELHGYIAVYLNDRETLYEMTEISFEDLPEEVQEEVRVGKHIKSEKELYAFLENYSS